MRMVFLFPNKNFMFIGIRLNNIILERRNGDFRRHMELSLTVALKPSGGENLRRISFRMR